MTKNIRFDLEFSEDGKVRPLTEEGYEFFRSKVVGISSSDIYKEAISEGLHVKFGTASIRDKIIGS